MLLYLIRLGKACVLDGPRVWRLYSVSERLVGGSWRETPGPRIYVKQWPFRPLLVVWGHYFTYCWGPGNNEGFTSPDITCSLKSLGSSSGLTTASRSLDFELETDPPTWRCRRTIRKAIAAVRTAQLYPWYLYMRSCKWAARKTQVQPVVGLNYCSHANEN